MPIAVYTHLLKSHYNIQVTVVTRYVKLGVVTDCVQTSPQISNEMC
jgi:hypothetical protein